MTTKFFKNDRFELTVNGNKLSLINKFGDSYEGYLDDNGRVVTKQRLGLGYLVAAVNDFMRQTKQSTYPVA
ncbi:MAG: hypothetical protein ACLR8Y_02120 [Alistipes indistinctus]